MSKIKPNIDQYYETCIRQIAYIYYSFTLFDINEEIYHNASYLVEYFGDKIEGVTLDENLIELGIQILAKSDPMALQSMGITLNTNRTNRNLIQFGTVIPKKRYASLKINRSRKVLVEESSSIIVNEQLVTNITMQLCELCLNIPIGYVYKQSFSETLIFKVITKSYKEIASYGRFQDVFDKLGDINDDDLRIHITGTKRSKEEQETTEAVQKPFYKQYSELQPRRQLGIYICILI
jgi:hypothetical protein